MNNFELQFDYLSALFLLLFLIFFLSLFKLKERFKKPSLLFPDLTLIPSYSNVSIKKKFSNAPFNLLLLSLASFSIAFIDPHYFTLKNSLNSPENKTPPKSGIAIYLIADESGSMMELINAKMENGAYENISKIDFLKKVTKPFIDQRKNDLIGLIAFSRTADIKVPLTLDHASIIEEISLLKPSILDADGGTAIGYAVFKTVNLIITTKHFANDLIKKGEPAYEIKNSIIVLVTDGVQNVNPQDVNDPFRSMDVTEAANYAKENNVRLYIVNVDPAILTSKFTPERNLMKRVTELTGGHFYAVDSANSLTDIYNEINTIEKTKIDDASVSKSNLPNFYRRVSFYPFFIGLGMCFLFSSILLETTFFKRVP